MTDLMQATTLPTQHGKKIGILTINNPKALNAQNYEMVVFTKNTLETWASDESIVMVLLHGTGERALCAGGDIKSLQSGDVKDAKDFFSTEYGLMYTIHTYTKPILAWGNGIVMGGGLGLLAASSHKVVTQSTLMAMPEVGIGLFPDAGASYFLNCMMGKVGLFLGLTGARFNGRDALYLGLADFAIEHEHLDALIERLTQIDFVDNATNHHLLSACLQEFHNDVILPETNVLPAFDEINKLMNAGDLSAVDTALLAYQGQNAFVASAIENYRYGSALTKALTWRIYHNLKTVDKDKNLKDIFAMETVVAVNCVHHGDFKEGVRALLIDKDKNPQWQFELSDITQAGIDKYFE